MCVAQKRLYLNKLPPGSLSPSTSNLNSIRLAGLLPVTSIEMDGLCHRPLLLNFSYGNKCPRQYRQGISEPGFTRGKILGNLIRYHDQGAEIAPSLCGAERDQSQHENLNKARYRYILIIQNTFRLRYFLQYPPSVYYLFVCFFFKFSDNHCIN